MRPPPFGTLPPPPPPPLPIFSAKLSERTAVAAWCAAKASADGRGRAAPRRSTRPADMLTEDQRESLADAFAEHNLAGDGCLSRRELAE